MASVERFGDVWGGELDNDSFLALRWIFWVFKPKIGVLTEGFICRED